MISRMKNPAAPTAARRSARKAENPDLIVIILPPLFFEINLQENDQHRKNDDEQDQINPS